MRIGRTAGSSLTIGFPRVGSVDLSKTFIAMQFIRFTFEINATKYTSHSIALRSTAQRGIVESPMKAPGHDCYLHFLSYRGEQCIKPVVRVTRDVMLNKITYERADRDEDDAF